MGVKKFSIDPQKRCVFEPYGAGRYRCARCGAITPYTKWPPEKIYRACRRPVGSRGLGDSVARLIDVVSRGRLKFCRGCGSRRAWLNRLWPYGHSWGWWAQRLFRRGR